MSFEMVRQSCKTVIYLQCKLIDLLSMQGLQKYGVFQSVSCTSTPSILIIFHSTPSLLQTHSSLFSFLFFLLLNSQSIQKKMKINQMIRHSALDFMFIMLVIETKFSLDKNPFACHTDKTKSCNTFSSSDIVPITTACSLYH